MRPFMLLLGGVTVAAPATAAAPAPVAFDWFEYSGRDAVFTEALPPGHYRNPILAGFYPDPSICQVGEDYYLINSSFAYFPGIPIFHSRDLVNWTQLGHVIDRPEQLPYDGLGVSRGIFAPAISHHDGTFYVVCTMVDAGGNFLVTATNPAGPWTNPVWFEFEGIDPSLFFAADGRAWMVNNGAPEGEPLYDGHRAIWIQEFEIATQKLVGPRRVLVNGGVDLAQQPVWIEGPHLYQRGEWYYLSCAEGGTSTQHSQVIFRSREVTGPYEPWSGNPILTQRDLDGSVPGAVTSTGHADLVTGPDGDWWAVFLACRPYDGRHYATGRETFLLPVTWTEDAWPRILPPGERVPAVVRGPAGASVLESTVPLTGNFTWRDEFAAPQLSPLWIMVREPYLTWWRLSPSQGHLELSPRADRLHDTNNPTYLARRVQHTHFDATAELAAPWSPGVSAGLVLFQNEHHHYFLGVRRADEHWEVFLERQHGEDERATLATAPAAAAADLRLRASVDAGTAAFSFSVGGGEWRVLVAAADASLLSTEVAGGFVGATVGIHARLEE